MSTPPNGNVPASELVEVQPGMFLERSTAAIFERARAEFGSLVIATPAGAYRSLAVQADMIANPAKYNLDAGSSIPLAKPGQSSHGLGTAFDVTIPGRAWAVAHLPGYGLVRTFGTADPGHWANPHPTFYDGSAPSNSGTATGWAFNEPDAATQARIQRALSHRGRYAGPADGVWGVESIKGIQTTIKNVGYAGAIDGLPGVNTCHFVQVYAQRFGSYGGPIDNVLGPNSWAGFALGLERP